MKNTVYSFCFIFALLGTHAFAKECGKHHSCYLSRVEHNYLINQMKQTSSSKELVRIITNDPRGVADPTRPQLLTLPDSQKKYVIGFTGQLIMVVDSLKDLVRGGIKEVQSVNLINAFGFEYGGEIDPWTGRPLGSDHDSTTWDVALFKVDSDGKTRLKVLAGAMGDDSTGHPFLISDGHNNTRQRLFFDAKFVKSSSGQYRLIASAPKAVLNGGVPINGNWVQRNAKGKTIFNHGYGGEPITFPNGDLFFDERGYVPFVHEMVVEQRNYRDPNAPDGVRRVPYRTAIVLTYLDKTLSRVVVPPKIILDVFKKGKTVWSATKRPSAGPLVEGPHIELRFNGKPVMSMAELNALRSKKSLITYQMLFSAGEFFGTYGSFMAYSHGSLENFKPVVDSDGELEDVTAPLRVLFTWIGRPVSFYVDGNEYLLIHGVDRLSLPEGIPLEVAPPEGSWQYFKRQEIVVPVERYKENGVEKLRLKDESGLIDYLRKFTPRKISRFRLRSFYDIS